MVKVQYAGFGFNLKGIGPVLRVGVQFVGSGFSLKGRCSKKSSKESPTSLAIRTIVMEIIKFNFLCNHRTQLNKLKILKTQKYIISSSY